MSMITRRAGEVAFSVPGLTDRGLFIADVAGMIGIVVIVRVHRQAVQQQGYNYQSDHALDAHMIKFTLFCMNDS